MNKSKTPQGVQLNRACTVLRTGLWGLFLILILGCSPEKATTEAQPALESDSQKASYGMGYNLSQNLKQQMGEVLDPEAFSLGVDDALAGKAIQLTDEQVSSAMQKLQAERASAADELGVKNMSEGMAYLAENAKREGVVTLESGLQYEILVEGTGAKPSATDRVTTHYEGSLIDGTVFDSSVARGEPAVFPVNGVIAGWVEALQLMSEGSKWRLYVPSHLAYGERGAGADIGPNATLIFEVELIKINE